MDSGQLIQAFRNVADDVAPPYLWSNTEVLQYLNIAQREAAIRSRYFRKRVKLTTQADVSEYDMTSLVSTDDQPSGLDGLIIDIEKVKIGFSSLTPIGAAECFDASSTGKPEYYCLDYTGKIVFQRTPNAEYTVTMDAIHLPVDLILDDTTECKFPKNEQYYLIYWALKLAYEKDDSDTVDFKKAAYYTGLFEQEFGFKHSLVTRVQHLRHKLVTF